MPFTVRLLDGPSSPFTFESVTPFVGPNHEYEHDDQEPPQVTSVRKTWTIQGRIYGANEAAVITKWDALKAEIENRTSQVLAVQLLRDGSVVEEIASPSSSAVGVYDEFTINTVNVPITPKAWTKELDFTIQISGTLRFAIAGVVSLKQQESFTYGENGLLVRTLTGEVQTTGGVSAQAVARLQFLALPSSSFEYLTNGPEGVDVEVTNRADTKARFTSRIMESGKGLPADVGPNFGVSVATSKVGNETQTITTVVAVGTGAAAAVVAQRPTSNLQSENIVEDVHRRTAVATYVQSIATSGGLLTTVRVITGEGYGNGQSWTNMSGGRRPIRHLLSIGPFLVSESIVIELIGTPSTSDFKFPRALDLHEDLRRRSITGPIRRSRGKDADSDVWVSSMRRFYGAAEPDPTIFNISNFNADGNQQLQNEAQGAQNNNIQAFTPIVLGSGGAGGVGDRADRLTAGSDLRGDAVIRFELFVGDDPTNAPEAPGPGEDVNISFTEQQRRDQAALDLYNTVFRSESLQRFLPFATPFVTRTGDINRDTNRGAP